MPDELRIEGALRGDHRAIAARQVECRINYAARGAQSGAALNRDLLQQLAAWNE
jgi:hypothetical protein